VSGMRVVNGKVVEAEGAVTHADWLAEGERLFGPDARDWRFVCPSCGHVQTVRDFEAAGVSQDTIYKVIGFSCIGRFTGAEGAFNREKWKPCNYTSGGLFVINKRAVRHEDGHITPAFDFDAAALGAVEPKP
jgi:hypothetical protein